MAACRGEGLVADAQGAVRRVQPRGRRAAARAAQARSAALALGGGGVAGREDALACAIQHRARSLGLHSREEDYCRDTCETKGKHGSWRIMCQRSGSNPCCRARAD